MSKLRVVFMGTPAFAVPSLQRLIGSPEYDIVAAVTQPDAPAGRGREVAMSPVKRLALANDLTVLQPERLRRPEAVAALITLKPDIMIVAAFGQILPRSVLDIPPLGTLNVHASLLPRWRGATPITAAILAGDAETGVTIMRLDEGMDTGDILSQATLPIQSEDTTGSLTGRLAELGAQLLMETLPRWVNGEIQARPQDGSQATTCSPMHKQSGRVDWRQPAAVLERMIRAYAPWPGAYCMWNGKLLKIVSARGLGLSTVGAEPGQVKSRPEGPAVVTGEGLLLLMQVQLEGKRVLPAADFVRGQRDFVGSKLQ